MKLKEILQQEKEMMTPFRRKLNYTVLPIVTAVLLLPLVAILFLYIANAEYAFLALTVWIGVCLLISIVLLCLNSYILRKETKLELESFSYLFTDVQPLEEDSVTIVEEEISYTLTAEGIKMEIPDKILCQNGEYTGQVFDEVQENVLTMPWENTEICLATTTRARRVCLALAIFSTDPTLEDVELFLPMSETLFRAIKTFGLEEYVKDELWTYLFYNPQDAFEQILTKGRIVTMRNKKTGKRFVDKYGNFIGDQEDR